MINWHRYSLDQIKQKWDDFIFVRTYPYKSTKKSIQSKHITSLDRETLIEHLLQRLDNVQNVEH